MPAKPDYSDVQPNLDAAPGMCRWPGCAAKALSRGLCNRDRQRASAAGIVDRVGLPLVSRAESGRLGGLARAPRIREVAEGVPAVADRLAPPTVEERDRADLGAQIEAVLAILDEYAIDPEDHLEVDGAVRELGRQRDAAKQEAEKWRSDVSVLCADLLAVREAAGHHDDPRIAYASAVAEQAVERARVAEGLLAAARADLLAVREQLAEERAAVTREEISHGHTIDQRDRAQGAADALAYAIAPQEEIGEHSSGNDPWANALEALQVERRGAALSALRAFLDAAVGDLDGARGVALEDVVAEDRERIRTFVKAVGRACFEEELQRTRAPVDERPRAVLLAVIDIVEAHFSRLPGGIGPQRTAILKALRLAAGGPIA